MARGGWQWSEVEQVAERGEGESPVSRDGRVSIHFSFCVLYGIHAAAAAAAASGKRRQKTQFLTSCLVTLSS